jgi:ABC-2 type transport system ATP-binding protein
MDNALEINNLSFSYRNNWGLKRLPGVSDISLVVKPGETFGFLGHNGGGKTTTIKCILNLLIPDSGKIKIFGIDSTDKNARTNIGYVSEQPYFYDHLTIKETLELFAGLSGIVGANAKTRINRAVELLQLGDRVKSPLRQLSKGWTQRVGLAQALLGEPKLLVLDEPFSGLDPIGRKEFREIFFNLKQCGTAIFMSSHILSDVEYLCDRASILSRGRIKGIFDITDQSIFGTGEYELVLINVKGDYKSLLNNSLSHASEIDAGRNLLKIRYLERKFAEAAMQQALTSSITIERYNYVKPNLEDVFVQLVRDENKTGSAA